MINELKALLEKNSDISGWCIYETHTASEELFTIKKAVEMNRSKDVRKYMLTVYVDGGEGDDAFTGVAQYDIAPSLNHEEIEAVIETAALSARYATNKPFTLVKPTDKDIHGEDRLAKAEVIDQMADIYKNIYSVDNYTKGYINSAEIFANVSYHRIVNSLGVDVSYCSNDYDIEVITQWKDHGEDVEIYEHYQYTDADTPIGERVEEQLIFAKDKSSAKPMPQLEEIPIVLGATTIKEIMEYYLVKGNARAVYQGISQSKIGDLVQGNVQGDYVSIVLDPHMKNSTKSKPVDADGTYLDEVSYIENGVIKTYVGSNQYASYLGIKPTGNIGNMRVTEGSISYEEMKSKPHIELISFSSFQKDVITGAFGGEIRLAKYYDGEKYHNYTGGSLAADIKIVQEHMYFTKEVVQHNEYLGPRAMMFTGTIASS